METASFESSYDVRVVCVKEYNVVLPLPLLATSSIFPSPVEKEGKIERDSAHRGCGFLHNYLSLDSRQCIVVYNLHTKK